MHVVVRDSRSVRVRRGRIDWVMDSDAVGGRTVAKTEEGPDLDRGKSCAPGAQQCCARTKSVANVEMWVVLHLNPAIWEAIAGTGWRGRREGGR